MTNEPPNKSTKVTPAVGIKPALRTKSQQRRARNANLASIPSPLVSSRNDLLPRLVISYQPIGRLVETARRVRKKDAVQIARVKASIAKFGVVVPVVVDHNMRIVHGHTVCDAAREIHVLHLVVRHVQCAEDLLIEISLRRRVEVVRRVVV